MTSFSSLSGIIYYMKESVVSYLESAKEVISELETKGLVDLDPQKTGGVIVKLLDAEGNLISSVMIKSKEAITELLKAKGHMAIIKKNIDGIAAKEQLKIDTSLLNSLDKLPVSKQEIEFQINDAGKLVLKK